MGKKSPPEAGRMVPQSGCSVHGVQAGQTCVGCLSQGELFTRAEVARRARERRG